MHNYKNDFKEHLLKYCIKITDEKIEQFAIYYRLLCEFNSHTNLVSSTELITVYLKHFVDSLAINLLDSELKINTNKKVIDIGIGGGFPGLPMIILYDNLSLTAVDSVKKKLKFIEMLAAELGISDRVEILGERAEDLAQNPLYREQYDLSVTRAVAKLNVISELCLPFVKVGGSFIAYKAKNVEEEISQARKAISILGGKVLKTQWYDISNENERTLVLISKIKPTPGIYPRNVGIPKKNPIS